MIATIEPLESRAFLSASMAGTGVEMPAPNAVAFRTVPAASGQQKQNLQKLANDLRTIQSNSNVTPAQVQTLVSDLLAVKAVATRPSKASVQKLVGDARQAAADKQISAAEKVLLGADVQAVLASASVPPNLASAVAADLQAIASALNVSAADVKLVFGDLKAIAVTFKAAHK